MKRISLYGNIFVDSSLFLKGAFTVNTSNALDHREESIGGIGNVVRFMSDVFPSHRIYVNTTVGNDDASNHVADFLEQNCYSSKVIVDREQHTSQAMIIIDQENNIRTSIVEWGACCDHRYFENEGDWHHFMYADRQSKLTPRIIESMSGTTSLDLCLGTYTPEQKAKIFSLIEAIDYVIISDVEAEALTGQKWDLAAEIIGFRTNKGAIVHKPSGSIFSDGRTSIHRECEVYSGLNVLGAGDFFASTFIALQLEGNSVEETMDRIHDTVVEYLRSRQ